MSNVNKAEKILEALASIQNTRVAHDSAVKECSHFVLPRKSDMRDISAIGNYGKGELSAYAKLFTRSARSSCQKMASGMFNYMTPKNQKWFKLGTGNAKLDELPQVYSYFDEVRDIMLNELSKSNFSEISHETYLNFGAIGTVCTYPSWNESEKKMVYKDIPYNTFWFTEDSYGKPNRVYRQFKMSAEQVVEKFGEENLKECVLLMKSYNSEKDAERQTMYTIVHLVEPNQHRDKKKIDKENKKFHSTYICQEDKAIIDEGGFDEIPYIVGRFLKYNTDGNVMGYSPAMDCLPNIKTLETLKRKLLFAIEKNINPAMARGVTMGMTPNKVRTSPNAINNFDSRNPDSMPKPILQQIDLQYGLQDLQEEAKEIEDAFFVNAFQSITNIDKSNATATEVLSREREALVQISPSISRIEDEWLEPLLENIFAILQKRGLFPDPPMELQNGTGISLEFTGVLSSAPKLSESNSTLSYFQELAVILEFMPEEKRNEILNSHDYFEITKTLQGNRNLPARFRRSKEDIQKEAEANAKAQKEAMEQQQLVELTKGQNLNEAPQEGSAMKGLAQQMEKQQ